MSEMQQTKKMEQPRTEHPKGEPLTHAQDLKRSDLTKQVPAGERGGAAMAGDSGDNKRRNVDAHTNLNVSGGFDSRAGKQAVAEHRQSLAEQRAKAPEAQTARQGGDASAILRRAGDQMAHAPEAKAANVARV